MWWTDIMMFILKEPQRIWADSDFLLTHQITVPIVQKDESRINRPRMSLQCANMPTVAVLPSPGCAAVNDKAGTICSHNCSRRTPTRRDIWCVEVLGGTSCFPSKPPAIMWNYAVIYAVWAQIHFNVLKSQIKPESSTSEHYSYLQVASTTLAFSHSLLLTNNVYNVIRGKRSPWGFVWRIKCIFLFINESLAPCYAEDDAEYPGSAAVRWNRNMNLSLWIVEWIWMCSQCICYTSSLWWTREWVWRMMCEKWDSLQRTLTGTELTGGGALTIL